jgi:hypothetical protein
VGGGDGANPEDKIGSDEPVSKEAAVAAAATLQWHFNKAGKMHEKKKWLRT